MNERRGDGFWLLIFLALLVAAKPAADAATPPPTPHARTYAKPDAPLPSSSAARLSPEAIYAYARRARFTPDQAVTATAIALAESKPSGNPRSHNPVPPDDSYCLMQINMLGPLGPARRARFHLARNEELYDPATCMRVAYAISAAGTDWSPWTTWTRGTYRQFLARARTAGGGR